MLRRTVIAVLAGAAAAGLVTATASAADSSSKPPAEASALKPILQKLYSKTGFDDQIARSQAFDQIQLVCAPQKAKDKRAPALKQTGWWSEAVLEMLYTGDQYVKQPGKIKEIVKSEFDTYPNGYEKIAGKVPFHYRGPNSYSPRKSFPMLLSVVDSKTDTKAYLDKTWASADPAFSKDWILVCVAESDVLDVTKDKVALMALMGKMFLSLNVDRNRIFVEGVGAACKSVQVSACNAMADRVAGVILRDPQEPIVIENCALYPTVVVKGPEGAEKAAAVLAKYKEVVGDAKAVELVAPDVASLTGACLPVAEWLKAAAPRELSSSYSWVATYDKDNICPNPFTGTLQIVTPLKRGEPTTVKVTFARATNSVDIVSTNMQEFALYMNDDLLDLDKEVEVFVNTKSMVKRLFDRSASQMLDFADQFSEHGRLFPVMYKNVVPTVIAPPDPKKEGEKDAPKDGDKKEPEKK